MDSMLLGRVTNLACPFCIAPLSSYVTGPRMVEFHCYQYDIVISDIVIFGLLLEKKVINFSRITQTCMTYKIGSQEDFMSQ